MSMRFMVKSASPKNKPRRKSVNLQWVSAGVALLLGISSHASAMVTISHSPEREHTFESDSAGIHVSSESVREIIPGAIPETVNGSIVSASVADNDHRVAERPEKQSRTRDGHTSGCKIFVTTNMLYDAALTPNIGLGIRVSDRVNVLADWMYARWSNHDKRRYWRVYGGDIEVRYRIGPRLKDSPLGGHYIGAYGSMACYDFQAGRDHVGVLSDKYNYAAGLSYTYSLPVSPRLNIDFSLGAGYLWGTYKKHRPIDDCDVWLSTHELGWLGPTRAGVTLVWLVGDAVKNNKKGGRR